MKSQVTVWPILKPSSQRGHLHPLPSEEALQSAAEIILRRYGSRAITLLTSPRPLEDGRILPARLGANDCYVALEEACRKMARVAIRHHAEKAPSLPFEIALDTLFPDPVAYLCRCIRSVISDTERAARREPSVLSLEQPIAGEEEGLRLQDILADPSEAVYPEETLVNKEERSLFRQALAQALRALPKNYFEALKQDIAREKRRQAGEAVPPETDKERQTVCRARAALLRLLKEECDPDNSLLNLLIHPKTTRPRHHRTLALDWDEARTKALQNRLLQSTWAQRTTNPLAQPDVEEAVVNEVNFVDGVEPPSPEMRKTLRVLDTYTLGDKPTSRSPEAQALYEKAWQLRKEGKLQEAGENYRAAFAVDPTFYPALTEAGAVLIQQGKLREALQIYLAILADPKAGEERYLAATNIADIYITWFDAGRNREQNIQKALYYASIAVRRPTPMRVCNLLLAYAKDRYYREAKQFLETALKANWPQCPPEKLLQTLFQIRDPDLVSWWTWLEDEMGKENVA